MPIKEIPIYYEIATKCTETFRRYMRKVCLSKKPQNDEEQYLLPFLLKVIKGRYGTVVRNEFDSLYENNYLPKWNDKMNSNFYITKNVLTNIMHGSKLVNNHFLEQKEKCSPASEDGYKKILFRYYCSLFFNTDLFNSKSIQYKMMRYFRLVNLMVKDDALFSIYEKVLSTYPDSIKEGFQNTFHKELSHNSTEDALLNFHNDILSLEDIVLRYEDWKSYYEMNSILLQRKLYHSLHLRTTCSDLNERLLFTCFLYCWHYGFNQANYTDIIFDGLHGVFGNDQKNNISRLFAVEKDKKVMKYFHKKYKSYCIKREIPKESQITILLNSGQPQSPTEEAPIKGNNSCRLDKPNRWNKEMITILVLSLANNQIIDRDSMSNFKHFLGFTHDSTEFVEKVIDWYGSRNSLKYFISILYNNKVPKGTWEAVQQRFTVKSKGKQMQLTNTDSLANLSWNTILENINCNEKEIIDSSITNAKK